MLKAGDFLTPEEIVYIKWVMELWNGKVTRVSERKHVEKTKEQVLDIDESLHTIKARRQRREL